MLINDAIDLATDPITGDLVGTTDLVLSKGISGVTQAANQRLHLFQGEWFLDAESGVPWFQSILGKKRDIVLIRESLRSVLLSTPGIEELLKLETTFDGATRILTVKWQARTVFGDTTIQELIL